MLVATFTFLIGMVLSDYLSREKTDDDKKESVSPPVMDIVKAVKSETCTVDEILEAADGDLDWLKSVERYVRAKGAGGVFSVTKEIDFIGSSHTSRMESITATDEKNNTFELRKICNWNSHRYFETDVFNSAEVELLFVAFSEYMSQSQNVSKAVRALENKLARDKLIRDYC